MRLTSLIAAAALCAAPFVADARNNAGAYLAARQAGIANDFSAAAEYYTRALALDASNTGLMESVILANVGMGWIDRAVPVARRLAGETDRSQVADLVLLADQIEKEDYDEIMLSYAEGREVGPLVDGLVQAWAGLGAGDTDAALAKFDAVSEEDGLKSFALYHKALALAAAGDFEGADDLLSGRAAGELAVPRRGVIAHAQILSQLERNAAAEELIVAVFGPTPPPVLDALLTKLRAGETVDYDVVTSAREGLGEVFFSVGGALYGETAHSYTLIYSRVAEYLDPRNVDAILLSATLLDELDQFDLATRAYDRVSPDSPAFVAAELGRADALLADDREEAAVEVLSQLAKVYPDLSDVHLALADTLRRLDRFEEAIPPYDRAIELIGEPDRRYWSVYFSRGIALERTDRWEEAERDFRLALELEPEQPQVLNYLGYSLVEMKIKLDEALDMIERAVAGRPDDGYITDSLGWVLYRLGRYDEAVGHMERAAELTPVDPIINDHLGDVYWAVGRQLEAQFQWRRALSFDPEPEEAERIRRKLEVGLDVVLEEEGADPIAVADEG
ncbi:MAG: tetratricopeptide repeat protein [Rhodobacteraceae bacterium]|nr:tetratricopeptide repeat protein [Paracoccaceae bacterium]